MRYLEDDIGNKTRQKGFSNILRSDVHIALVYLASIVIACARLKNNQLCFLVSVMTIDNELEIGH